MQVKTLAQLQQPGNNLQMHGSNGSTSPVPAYRMLPLIYLVRLLWRYA